MAKRRRPSRLNHNHKQHELDIIIPVYGRPDLLRECLQSIEIAAIDVDYQIILIDDKSPDQAAINLVYDSLNSSTKIFRNQENRGFPATVNRGVSFGKAPAILVHNTDVTLRPGAVRVMLGRLWGDEPKGPIAPSADAQVGIVGPKLLFPESGNVPPDARGKVQHAGLAINGRGIPFHIQKGWAEDNPRLNEPRAMQAVTGACMMIRRETWDVVTRNYRRSGDPTGGGV